MHVAQHGRNVGAVANTKRHGDAIDAGHDCELDLGAGAIGAPHLEASRGMFWAFTSMSVSLGSLFSVYPSALARSLPTPSMEGLMSAHVNTRE